MAALRTPTASPGGGVSASPGGGDASPRSAAGKDLPAVVPDSHARALLEPARVALYSIGVAQVVAGVLTAPSANVISNLFAVACGAVLVTNFRRREGLTPYVVPVNQPASVARQGCCCSARRVTGLAAVVILGGLLELGGFAVALWQVSVYRPELLIFNIMAQPDYGSLLLNFAWRYAAIALFLGVIMPIFHILLAAMALSTWDTFREAAADYVEGQALAVQAATVRASASRNWKALSRMAMVSPSMANVLAAGGAAAGAGMLAGVPERMHSFMDGNDAAVVRVMTESQLGLDPAGAPSSAALASPRARARAALASGGGGGGGGGASAGGRSFAAVLAAAARERERGDGGDGGAAPTMTSVGSVQRMPTHGSAASPAVPGSSLGGRRASGTLGGGIAAGPRSRQGFGGGGEVVTEGSPPMAPSRRISATSLTGGGVPPLAAVPGRVGSTRRLLAPAGASHGGGGGGLAGATGVVSPVGGGSTSASNALPYTFADADGMSPRSAHVVTDEHAGRSMDATAFRAAEAALGSRVRDDPSLVLQEGGGGDGYGGDGGGGDDDGGGGGGGGGGGDDDDGGVTPPGASHVHYTPVPAALARTPASSFPYSDSAGGMDGSGGGGGGGYGAPPPASHGGYYIPPGPRPGGEESQSLSSASGNGGDGTVSSVSLASGAPSRRPPAHMMSVSVMPKTASFMASPAPSPTAARPPTLTSPTAGGGGGSLLQTRSSAGMVARSTVAAAGASAMAATPLASPSASPGGASSGGAVTSSADLLRSLKAAPSWVVPSRAERLGSGIIGGATVGPRTPSFMVAR